MQIEISDKFIELLADELVERLAQRLEPILREPKKVEQKLYSRQETADLLHVSFPTLDKYSKKGLLTPIRMGDRRVLFDATEIQKIIESGMSPKYTRR